MFRSLLYIVICIRNYVVPVPSSSHLIIKAGPPMPTQFTKRLTRGGLHTIIIIYRLILWCHLLPTTSFSGTKKKKKEILWTDIICTYIIMQKCIYIHIYTYMRAYCMYIRNVHMYVYSYMCYFITATYKNKTFCLSPHEQLHQLCS